MLIFSCSSATRFAPFTTSPHHAQSTPLAIAMAGALNKYEIPAIQVAYSDGRQIYTEAIGHENFKRANAITSDHLMHMGSGTKMFTAVATMIQVQKNAIQLDAPLSNWFPAFPGAPEITVRMLLNHSSGIPNIFKKKSFLVRSMLHKNKVWRTEKIIESMSEEPLDFKPGTDFRYSNTNYILLGAILEKTTQLPLNTLFHKFIFEPQFMQRTFLSPQDKTIGQLTSGGIDIDYLPFGRHYMPPENASWDSLTGASGACVSTAEDMVRFLNGVFDGSLLEEHTREKMLTFDFERTDKPQPFATGYGLGIVRYNIDGEIWYGHGGAIMGWESLSLHQPNTHRSIVVIINKTQLKSDIFNVFHDIQKALA